MLLQASMNAFFEKVRTGSLWSLKFYK